MYMSSSEVDLGEFDDPRVSLAEEVLTPPRTKADVHAEQCRGPTASAETQCGAPATGIWTPAENEDAYEVQIGCRKLTTYTW